MPHRFTLLADIKTRPHRFTLLADIKTMTHRFTLLADIKTTPLRFTLLADIKTTSHRFTPYRLRHTDYNGSPLTSRQCLIISPLLVGPHALTHTYAHTNARARARTHTHTHTHTKHTQDKKCTQKARSPPPPTTPTHTPCGLDSFKAASFKCGKAEVDVYPAMSYKRTMSSAKRGPWKGKEIALRQVSGVLVNISTTKGNGQVTYRLYTFLVKVTASLF